MLTFAGGLLALEILLCLRLIVNVCGGCLQVSYTRNNAVLPLSLFINIPANIQDLERSFVVS
jgi:hypothetical protein